MYFANIFLTKLLPLMLSKRIIFHIERMFKNNKTNVRHGRILLCHSFEDMHK